MFRTSLIVIALAFAGLAHASDKLQFGAPGSWVEPLPVPATQQGAASTAPVEPVVADVQVKFDGQGELIYQHRAIRFQSPEALQLGRVSLSWNPDTDTITVHEVRILREGQTIDLLARGQKFTILRRETDLERAMLNGVLTATLQPEGLQAGDVLELAYTLGRRDPVLRYHSEALLTVFPKTTVGQLQFREVWPKSKAIRWRESDGLNPGTVKTSPDGSSELVIEESNAQRPEPPDGAPPRYGYLSVLEASDFTGWGEISELMDPLYVKAATLAPNSPLRAEVAKIRTASADPKIQAVMALRLVQDQVRYLFLGMNEGGYVPADADLTWTRRFGDCKGKTALLLALLHELGIKAEPALVSSTAGDGMNERLPLVEFFDHVLVRAETGGRVYWLDGTRTGDRSLDSIVNPTFVWALPVTSSGADLERIAPQPLADPAVDMRIRLDASAGLDAIAPAHVEELIRGDAARLMGLGFSVKSPSDLDKALRDYWTGIYPSIEVKSVKAEYDDATNEERLTMDGAASMTWALNAGYGAREYEADGSELANGRDFKREAGPHPDAPFAVPFPDYETTTETILLPQDGKGFTAVGEDVDKTLAGVEYKRSTHIDGSVFTMTSSVRSLVTEIPASEANAEKPALREISGAMDLVRAPANYTASPRELQARLARTPTLASEFADRAGARVEKQDYAGAVQDYDEALKLKPDDDDFLNARCFTRGIENADLKLAMDDCNAAVDQAPHDAAYLDSRGFVHFREGDLQQALVDYDAALEIDPKAPTSLYVRGLIERRLGKAQQADTDVKAAVALDPTVVATYASYGVSDQQPPLGSPEASGQGIIACVQVNDDGSLSKAFVMTSSGDSALDVHLLAILKLNWDRNPVRSSIPRNVWFPLGFSVGRTAPHASSTACASAPP